MVVFILYVWEEGIIWLPLQGEKFKRSIVCFDLSTEVFERLNPSPEEGIKLVGMEIKMGTYFDKLLLLITDGNWLNIRGDERLWDASRLNNSSSEILSMEATGACYWKSNSNMERSCKKLSSWLYDPNSCQSNNLETLGSYCDCQLFVMLNV